ncbi:MAG: phage tail tape measure protein [Rhodospirillaceae bacterium]|nr:phage tail tape measure protein [Rhodospirillales bacterium]
MTVMTVQVDIGAVLKDGFTAAFGKAQGTAVKLDNAIAAVDTRIGTMKGWADAKRETAAAREEWTRAEAKAKALAAQLAATAAPTEEFKSKVAAAKAEADKAKAAFMGTATSLKAVSVQMTAAGLSAKSYKADLDAAEKSMATLERRKESLNRAMASKAANAEARDALKGQVLGTMALAGAMAAPVHQAIKFESAMADVRKAVNFEDPVNGLKNMEVMIKDLARDIPIAQDGIAAIVSAGGRMDIGEKDLRAYTVTVSKMSTAWEMAPEAAGDAMGKIKNIMGLSIKDLELVGDAINKLDDSSTAKAVEIVDVIKRAGGGGKQFGLNTQQVAALATSFLDLGSTGDIAATSINALLGKMQSAPVQSAKFQKGLKELGWDAKDMQKAIGEDAQGTLIKFLETVKELDKDTRVNTLAEMFGAEYSDDMAKLTEGLDTYKKHLKTVSDQSAYAGSMTAEFGIRSQTTANQLQLTSNAMNRAAINIGSALLPAVNGIAKGLASATDTLAVFAEAHPVVTKVVVYTTAAIIAYKVATLALKFAWTTAKAPFLDARILVAKMGAESAASAVKTRQMGGAVQNAQGALARTAAAASSAAAKLRAYAGSANVAAGASSRLAAAQAGIGDLAVGGKGGLAGKLGGVGKMGKALRMGGKALGGAGTVISAGFAVSDLMDDTKSKQEKAGSVGNLAGGIAGAAAGAAIGSVVPVIGTVIGGILGGLVGAYGGEKLGEKLYSGKGDDKATAGAKDAAPANDNPVNDNMPKDDIPKRKAGGATLNQTITINVYAQPGQSPEAVAGAVQKSFQAQTGGGLYDE